MLVTNRDDRYFDASERVIKLYNGFVIQGTSTPASWWSEVAAEASSGSLRMLELFPPLTSTNAAETGSGSFISDLKDISVWWVNLDQWHWSQMVLSAAELSRAHRFHFELDRRRFVASRSALRILLARCVNGDAEALAFDTGKYGKPHLRQYGDFHFNLTHSHDLAGVAVTREGPIGLDCERIQEMSDFRSLCERICSSDELDIMSRHGSERCVELFFRAWTRKEAILKALGLGLSFPPNTLTVLSWPEATQLRIEVPGHGAWWVSTLNVPPGYAAACCTPFRIELQ